MTTITITTTSITISETPQRGYSVCLFVAIKQTTTTTMMTKMNNRSNILTMEDLLHKSILERLTVCFTYKCINFVITMLVSSINARTINLSKGISFEDLLSFFIVWAFCLMVQFAGYEILMSNQSLEYDQLSGDMSSNSSLLVKNFVWVTYAACGSFVFVPIVACIYHFSKATLLIITIVNIDIILSLLAFVCTVTFCSGGMFKKLSYTRIALVYYSVFCLLSFAIFYNYHSYYHQQQQQQSQKETSMRIVTVLYGVEVYIPIEFSIVSIFYATWLFLYVQKIISSTDEEARWKMSLLLFWLPEYGVFTRLRSFVKSSERICRISLWVLGRVITIKRNSSFFSSNNHRHQQQKNDKEWNERLIPMHD